MLFRSDPENAEAWYFSAMLKARSKNAAATEADLKTAIEKGFNDINRMQMQPEFQMMNTQIDFGKLIELIESRSKR